MEFYLPFLHLKSFYPPIFFDFAAEFECDKKKP